MTVRIHPTADVSPEAKIGDGTSIWQHVQIRAGVTIGNNCVLGKGVFIDRDVSIGSNVKIQNYVSVYQGVTIENGVLVQEVLPGSPAAFAGLKAGTRIVVLGARTYALGGDIITAVGGKDVSTTAEIARALLQSRPGEVLRLTVLRAGRQLDVEIRLENMRMQF